MNIRGGGKQENNNNNNNKPTTKTVGNKIVTKIFENADTNHDGTINTTELYEILLLYYISINQKAPVPPPSREVVNRLFVEYDSDKSNTINMHEFAALIKIFGRRALIKIVTYKFFSLLIAPLLAEYVVHAYYNKESLTRITTLILPTESFRTKAIPILTSKTFVRTLLIAIFVSTLGNAGLMIVNTIMNMSLPKLTSSSSNNNNDKKKNKNKK